MNKQNSKLIRIGVFYDGSYFYRVNKHYLEKPEKKIQINISSLHNFIRDKIAEIENISKKTKTNDTNNLYYPYHLILDSHYFQGRISTEDAETRDLLLKERKFDNILMEEGITTHYLKIKKYSEGEQEKGIDVWLALEAFELAFHKRFNILVLISGDGDFVPLIKKLNILGIRVMLLWWEFTDSSNEGKGTGISQDLLNIVNYPIAMHKLIDDEPSIKNLFKETRNNKLNEKNSIESNNKWKRNKNDDNRHGKGKIFSVWESHGYIEREEKNTLYFDSNHFEGDFKSLNQEDKVVCKIEKNEKGENIIVKIKKKEENSITSEESTWGMGKIVVIEKDYGHIKIDNLHFYLDNVIKVDNYPLNKGDKVTYRIIKIKGGKHKGKDTAVDVKKVQS